MIRAQAVKCRSGPEQISCCADGRPHQCDAGCLGETYCFLRVGPNALHRDDWVTLTGAHTVDADRLLGNLENGFWYTTFPDCGPYGSYSALTLQTMMFGSSGTLDLTMDTTWGTIILGQINRFFGHIDDVKFLCAVNRTASTTVIHGTASINRRVYAVLPSVAAAQWDCQEAKHANCPYPDGSDALVWRSQQLPQYYLYPYNPLAGPCLTTGPANLPDPPGVPTIGTLRNIAAAACSIRDASASITITIPQRLSDAVMRQLYIGVLHSIPSATMQLATVALTFTGVSGMVIEERYGGSPAGAGGAGVDIGTRTLEAVLPGAFSWDSQHKQFKATGSTETGNYGVILVNANCQGVPLGNLAGQQAFTRVISDL